MVDFRVGMGYAFCFLVWILGAGFIWVAYFDPAFPYLPAGSDALVLFVTGAMGATLQWALGTATSSMTARQSTRAVDAGKQAALAVPGQQQEPPDPRA